MKIWALGRLQVVPPTQSLQNVPGVRDCSSKPRCQRQIGSPAGSPSPSEFRSSDPLRRVRRPSRRRVAFEPGLARLGLAQQEFHRLDRINSGFYTTKNHQKTRSTILLNGVRSLGPPSAIHSGPPCAPGEQTKDQRVLAWAQVAEHSGPQRTAPPQEVEGWPCPEKRRRRAY